MASSNDSGKSGGTLPELTVPASQVELFRIGIIRELKNDTEGVLHHHKETAEAEDSGHPRAAACRVDFEEYLPRPNLIAALLLAAAKPLNEDGSLTVEADPEALSCALGETAELAGGRLTNALNVEPLEGDKVAFWQGVIAWAVDWMSNFDKAAIANVRERKAQRSGR